MAKPKYHTNLVGHKVCSRCAQELPYERFHRRANRKSGYSSWCKECDRKRQTDPKVVYHAAYYESNRERANAKIRDTRYGLTPGQYEEMLSQQSNRCAICERPERMLNKRGEIRRLSVDHCHATNAVRGLLCSHCNHGIGKFDDDIELLEKAITYLKMHQERK